MNAFLKAKKGKMFFVIVTLELMKEIEDITWPRGDTIFIFEW